MRKRLISLFLIGVITVNSVGTAYALSWDDVKYIPMFISGFGSIWGYLLGLNDGSKYYKQQLQKLQNISNVESFNELLNKYEDSEVLYCITQDFAEYTKATAWSIAKITTLKALKEGKSPEEAKIEAKKAVISYFDAISKALVNVHNSQVETVWHVKQLADNKTINYKLVFKDRRRTYATYEPGRGWSYPRGGYFMVKNIALKNKTIIICGVGYNIRYIAGEYCYRDYLYHPWKSASAECNVYARDVKVYDAGSFYNAVNKLNTVYANTINNIDKYVDCLIKQVDISKINLSDLLTPTDLAVMFDKDWNSTGYYGFAAAELALLGLNTTGLTKTITIKIDNKTISGIPFADFDGELKANNTFTIPKGHYLFLVTEDGKLLKIPSGTIEIIKLRDARTGQLLNSTNFTTYAPTTSDANKIYEELEKRKQLYWDYLNMTTVVGGGGSSGNSWANALNDFWNGLDWQVKALIVGGGILAGLVLIGRAFGRGGVSVIKMGK